MPNDYADLDEYARTRFPAYPNTTFEGICQSFITGRQIEKLRKILNFTFTRHPKMNLPDGHLAAIEKHIKKRASQLIGLARPKSKAMGTEKPSLLSRLDEAKREAEAVQKNTQPRRKTDREEI
jgi:hypothetical protein